MIGSLIGGAISVGSKYGIPALMVRGSVSSYQDKVRQGQNPAFAAAVEGVNLAGSFLLPLPAQLAVYGIPVTRAVTAAIISGVRQHNNFIRMARTPFSHRFEHTDVTARAQQLGLQSIGAAWGYASMGSEASMMARRYAR